MMFLQQFPWCERYIILQEPAEGAENGTAANGMEETLRYLGHHDTACLSTSVCYLAVSKAVTMSRVHSAADIIGVKNNPEMCYTTHDIIRLMPDGTTHEMQQC